MKERDNIEDTDGRIILKWKVNRVESFGLNSYGLGQRTVIGLL